MSKLQAKSNISVITDEFETDGFSQFTNVIDEVRRATLIGELPSIDESGTRTLLANPAFAQLARELRNSKELGHILLGLVAVQCTYFRKTPDNNWAVRLHRDFVIPAKGHGPWKPSGTKEGVSTVSADKEFLNRCVAVRVHLDGAPIEDIRVVPGSHRDGSSSDTSRSVALPVQRLGALVMRPALLHGSSRLGPGAGSRRVLHYLFAPETLCGDYSWHFSV